MATYLIYLSGRVTGVLDAKNELVAMGSLHEMDANLLHFQSSAAPAAIAEVLARHIPQNRDYLLAEARVISGGGMLSSPDLALHGTDASR
jgi:hypothetical protein